MSAEIRPITNNNYVKINVGDDITPRHYVVNKDKADTFVKEFKKQEQKTSIITNTAFFGSILAGTGLGLLATKNISSTFFRYTLNCLCGVAGGLASYVLTGNLAQKSQDKVVKKFGAQKG